jgi:hypothetical protein
MGTLRGVPNPPVASSLLGGCALTDVSMARGGLGLALLVDYPYGPMAPLEVA